jgi:hypothetical protein
MALSDPQSITIGSDTISLPATSRGDGFSKYSGVAASDNAKVLLTLSNAYGRRTRRVIRIDHQKDVPDPYNGLKNVVSMSNYMVFDIPVLGYTAAEAKAIYSGLKTLYTASSDSVITKLLGGES